ncbi:preprotein translocase subunit SecG [Streptomyces sp. NPDC006393]|uniref:preprotein translocase subunit SecG n=1 Tax=Streptomyces sp. NPDC006393 TaxID=3156763 RepID=UPI0033D153CF
MDQRTGLLEVRADPLRRPGGHVVVGLQEGKSNGLSGAISGGAEQLFGKQKQKQRGVDLFLHRLTIILSVIFFLLMIGISYLGL